MIKRWQVGLIVVWFILALGQLSPALATHPDWMITPVYAPIGHAPIVDREYVMPAHGIVHLEGTTWIDDGWGRTVIAGHNPGTFAPLVELDIGASIILMSDGDAYEYRVAERHITTDNTAWLAPTKSPTLTLITCLDRGITWLIINAIEVN